PLRGEGTSPRATYVPTRSGDSWRLVGVPDEELLRPVRKRGEESECRRKLTAQAGAREVGRSGVRVAGAVTAPACSGARVVAASWLPVSRRSRLQLRWLQWRTQARARAAIRARSRPASLPRAS